MTVKVRFAPSPTGNLHVGNIRTALINYFYCKVFNGKFLLRIDDTDTERSKNEYTENIKSDLIWLGIKWDQIENQSSRFRIYNDAIKKLEKIGRAYKCYETPEELTLKRKSQLISGKPPVYDRSSLNLTKEDHLHYEKLGKKPHWRFRLIHEEVLWNDIVRGKSNVHMSALSDPVLMREDGRPIYTLSSVVDDIEHNITHIIRGEDHVTNSAAQLQLFEALGALPPFLGHLSLLSGAEGEGLSKRFGSLTLSSLKEKNITPMAILSLLSRLGSSDPIIPQKSLKNILQTFDIKKFGRNTSKFDIKELIQINQKIIQNLQYIDVKEELLSLGLHCDEDLWNTISGNLQTFSDVQFWKDVIYGKIIPIIENEDLMKIAINLFPTGTINNDSWGIWTKQIIENTSYSGKNLFLPLRKALTGLNYGPELKFLLPLLGKNKIIDRLSGKEA